MLSASASQAAVDVSQDLRADGLVTVAEACAGQQGRGAHDRWTRCQWPLRGNIMARMRYETNLMFGWRGCAVQWVKYMLGMKRVRPKF